MWKRQQIFGHVSMLIDAIVVVGAWFASYWGRFFVGPLPAAKGLPEFATYSALAPLLAVLWVTVFMLMRVYESGRSLGQVRELQLLLKAHGVALLLFIALTYLFEEYKYSRLVMAYFAVLSGTALVGLHVAQRSALYALRARGFSRRKALAIGEGAPLQRLIERIDGFPELGLVLSGVVTPEASRSAAGSGELVFGKPILGHFPDVIAVIRAAKVDEVLIALPTSHSQELDRLLDVLKDETLDVRVVPDVHRHVTLSCEIEDLAGLPVLRINDSPLMGWGAIAKRATDTVLSALALVVLSPLLLVIALLVKLTSPGPVLYVQERMGLIGRSFAMLKFRSMRMDAESQTGAVWAQAADQRRTAFGTFLRKTSLDELPQLWNVLRGDMSLVGPRPERPVFVDRFRTEIPHYMLRHKVHAGITGWAQVNGWRGNTSLDRRIECDLFYIRNWSYALDLKILTLTLWKGFIHRNAY